MTPVISFPCLSVIFRDTEGDLAVELIIEVAIPKIGAGRADDSTSRDSDSFSNPSVWESVRLKSGKVQTRRKAASPRFWISGCCWTIKFPTKEPSEFLNKATHVISILLFCILPSHFPWLTCKLRNLSMDIRSLLRVSHVRRPHTHWRGLWRTFSRKMVNVSWVLQPWCPRYTPAPL